MSRFLHHILERNLMQHSYIMDKPGKHEKVKASKRIHALILLHEKCKMQSLWSRQTQEKSKFLVGSLSGHCKPRATVRAMKHKRQVIDK